MQQLYGENVQTVEFNWYCSLKISYISSIGEMVQYIEANK